MQRAQRRLVDALACSGATIAGFGIFYERIVALCRSCERGADPIAQFGCRCLGEGDRREIAEISAPSSDERDDSRNER